MKIALAAATGLVFAALWLFDTQALIRLTAACVTGECGVHPAWFAGAAALLAAGTVVFGRRPPPESGTKPGIARTTARPRTPAKSTTARSRKKSSGTPAASRTTSRPRPVSGR